MSRKRSPYSSHVVLRLVIAGQVISLSQVGSSFVVLRKNASKTWESCDGRVDVIVDDRVASSTRVFFPNGIEAGSKKASYF
ncbi:MAG: hypothetical protein AAF670_02785 [Planctomycetota bacterium]